VANLFRKKSISTILKQIEEGNSEGETHSLKKSLGVKDLTALGIAAIIGAGIFSTIGNASASGGPAVIFLFLFTALACGFSAFAYAEFASMIPVSGSAYTYSYVAFGEIIAWLIGWALVMEYAIGNIAVAISWSDYFTHLLSSIHIKSLGINGIYLQPYFTTDYLTAKNGFTQVSELLTQNTPVASIQNAQYESYMAWKNAPQILGIRCIADLPALAIIVFITWLVYRGMQESKNASNIMVAIKLLIIFLVIIVGVFYVDTNNWTPFAPNGINGVLKGISAVFFAYIGFDAISTTAEECKNPQKDLPRGMMYAIVICTVLYVVLALILTGMVSYSELAVGDPLAFVFEKVNVKWMAGIISVSAVVAMASVLLVFQLGQPRIWMSMSRDGLLPSSFSKIHSKYKTPSNATIITGIVVAIPALFLNLTTVTDLCSIGTLFAFVLVCAGVLTKNFRENSKNNKFKTPYINSKIVLPVASILFLVFFAVFKPNTLKSFFSFTKYASAEEISNGMQLQDKANFLIIANSYKPISKEVSLSNSPVEVYLTSLNSEEFLEFATHNKQVFAPFLLNKSEVFMQQIPFLIFLIILVLVNVWAIKNSLSLIPILGLLSCLYMMSEIGLSNWIGFSVWLLVGLVIYFSYGYRNSKLNT
jgi:basic amino acid/polyamine antiporter, APA family